MKMLSTVAIMPKRKSFVLASLVIAIVATATSALAGRQIHGGDVARMLTGKNFQIECIDGTTGRGQVSQHGVATVAYRRPDAPRGAPEQLDNAVVRVRGAEICLAWREFGGGGDGCYPVSEEAQGRFRLSTGPLWCDIKPNFK